MGLLNELPEKLEALMFSKGLNPTDISRMAKMSPVTIKRALSGNGKLSVYIAIARAMGATIKITVE